MLNIKEVSLWIVLVITLSHVNSVEIETKEDLVESESKDGTLEIIKQIKKVNNDGSYTVGYEADDGSFKIESRDVLGNIKGTYGFLDDSGQLKRVSYTTSNSSEVIPKVDEGDTVVQRIPKTNNRTVSSTTKRPGSIYTTIQPSTSNVIQNIAKRRTSSSSTTTTTENPNYEDIVNINSESDSSSKSPQYVYATPITPKNLIQNRQFLKSTLATHTQTQKSEGQLIRPELIASRPTELPLFRRLALTHHIVDKPVTEEPEVKANILRRQLSPDKLTHFNPQQHVFMVQQSEGDDSSDVYGGSVTGTSRPLFTTTNRPRILSSTTPISASHPTARFSNNLQLQRNSLQDTSTAEYTEETTNESNLVESTPTSVPIVQIPANRPQNEQLVAIRHPYQKETIYIPLSQLQGRLVTAPFPRNIQENFQPNYEYQQQQQQQYIPRPADNRDIDPRQFYVRRLPPPQLRPMPVQVDEQGYIREYPPQDLERRQFPVPVPVSVPKYIHNNEIQNGIEDIAPPVSTRDFQTLLHHLVLRQNRLERLHELTDPRRHPELYQSPTRRPIYQQNIDPYYSQRLPQNDPRSGPVQFLPENSEPRRRHFVPQGDQQYTLRQDQRLFEQEQYANPQSYVPNKRVARLLKNNTPQQQDNEDFLPPDVREMLLLRMLQLAINPSLPIDSNDLDSEGSESTSPPTKKVRNVEILGEEPERMRKSSRNKRYKDTEFEYLE